MTTGSKQQHRRQARTSVFINLLVGTVVLLAILACGSTSTTSGSNGGSGGSAPTATASGPAKVGDTITVDSVSCTLVSVKPIAGDDFTQPKAGNEFIVVHVKIVNKSSSEFNYNPFDFHVKSGSGNITDEEAVPPSTYTANNELNAGTLAAGGSVEGDIIFQATKGDHKAQLTWSPSVFSDKTSNAWNLGL